MTLKLIPHVDWDGNEDPKKFMIIETEDWGYEMSLIAILDSTQSDYRPEDLKAYGEEMCESYNQNEVYFIAGDKHGYGYWIHGIYTDKDKAERICETLNKKLSYNVWKVETHKLNQKIDYCGYQE